MHIMVLLHELNLKLIFHCNAKPFVLGSFGSPNAKDSTFALPNADVGISCTFLALAMYISFFCKDFIRVG